MYLSIFLRTHDRGNFHNSNRFINKEKKEIVEICAKSLIESINLFDRVEETHLTIIDDHSTEQTVEKLKSLLASCRCKSEFVPLEKSGNGESLKKCYETALSKGANLIYFVEDDHLHKPEAIQYMVNAWNEFSKRLQGNQVVIAPYDDPIDYHPERIVPTRLVATRDCHWRQNSHTTCTMMLTKWVLLHFWDKFMTLTNYGVNGVCEDNTINTIYRKEEVFLFTPVPFLAIHLQDMPPVTGGWEWFIEEKFAFPQLQKQNSEV